MRFKGINHLAMVTGDLDATVRFYRDILEMPLVAAIGSHAGAESKPFKHYFFELGAGNTIAFFEWPGVKAEHKPAGEPVSGNVQFDHISFNVESEADLLALQRRLREHGIQATRVVDHGFIHSIYFTDPNGIALEASYWVTDPTGQPPAYGDKVLFGDPSPVPALREAIEQAKAPAR